MTGDDWTTEFYVEESSTCPVAEFLDSLDAKTRARFGWSMEQLRVRNIQARAPLVKYLEGELWELREESQTNIYRISYIFFAGRRIVFLHGFQKKSQKTPTREIETAKRYLQRFRIQEELKRQQEERRQR